MVLTQPLTRQLRWLIVLRLVIVTSIAVPYFFFDFFLPDTTVTTPVGVVLPTEDAGTGAEPEVDDLPAPRGEPPGEGGEAPSAGEEERAGEEATAGEPSAAGLPRDPSAADGTPQLPAGPEELAAGAEAAEASAEAPDRRTALLIAERQRVDVAGVVIYRLAALVYLASLLYIVLLRLLPRRPVVQAYVQFVGDLLLITGLVYFTGGITSPFSLFYLVVIAVAATLLRRQAAFWVATAAYLLYAATLLGIYFGHLPTPLAQEVADDPIYRLTYNLVVNFVGFYAVAVLTAVLAQRVTRAERELEVKQENLADLQVVHRDVIQSITSGLATTDVDGRVTSLNRAGEEILDLQERELVGRPIEELLGRRNWLDLTRGDHRRERRSRHEVELERGGEPIYVGFTVSPLTDAAGHQHGWNVVFQDFTRWRRLEEQVRIKDRMAAVGELAAGIAHEIGNPLAAISGSVQMLSSSLEGSAQEQRLLDILLKESQRLDRTIKGFLRFARPKERSTVEFDVAHLLRENFELLENSDEVSPEHRLELVLEPESVPLVADPDQVSQIFWNLARNALKAMPDGGELRVEGRLAGGDQYRLSVTDTGSGMSEEQRANLFHPFQSFFDSGSGIGMAIVYRIVQDHGGRVEVESAEAQGTTIAVTLPVVAPQNLERPEAQGSGEGAAAAEREGAG